MLYQLLIATEPKKNPEVVRPRGFFMERLFGIGRPLYVPLVVRSRALPQAGRGTGITGTLPVLRKVSQRSMYSRVVLGMGVRARVM